MARSRVLTSATPALPRRLPAGPALVPVAVVLLLAYLPYLSVPLPGILPGLVNGPGSMQLLATCLTTAGIAVSYDVLFGRTGLLSFGHALFVAAGSYALSINMAEAGLPLPAAALVSLALTTLLAVVVGAVALRVGGIAFAMVTLAFAQAGAIVVQRNPGGWTGGEEGRTLNRDGMPGILLGVVGAPYRYWLALAFVVLTASAVAWLARSRAGHAMAAVRENEARAAVLGFDVYRTKLLSVVVGSFLAGLGGIVLAVVLGGSNPHVTTPEFTLSLLVMVVLGGSGSLWGALLGGFLYSYADARLVELSGSSVIGSLPAGVGSVLSQPLFVLGTFFVIVVYFAPTGLAGLGRRLTSKGD
jgi:branched-chain amino acid transport system permease protein